MAMRRSLSDLHRHLDGSLRLETLQELAHRHDVELPADLRFRAGMGLDEALKRFAVTLAVLQSPRAVTRVATEICQDAAAEGVTTLEIRFAPQLHRGAPVAAIVDAALEGLAAGTRSGRPTADATDSDQPESEAAGPATTGLILCALFGDPPSVLNGLVECAATRPGVVGIDIAGGPLVSHHWSMSDYAAGFARARDLGLGRTVHAGEGRPPAEIRTAIVELGAQRIGHGTTLLEDPEIVDLVIERQVVIEACPTSNVHTGAIPTVGDHPLPQWLARGVRACINSDNTLLSATDAATELDRAAGIPGMTPELVERCVETGHGATFRRTGGTLPA